MRKTYEYTIDKNIPMPEPKVGRKSKARKLKYPFPAMKVNDSFMVKCRGKEVAKVRSRLSASANYWGERHAKKFACRQVKGGLRVWRRK